MQARLTAWARFRSSASEPSTAQACLQASSTPALSCSCLLDRAQSKAHTPEQARIEAKNSRENTSTRTVNTRPAQGSYELVERRYFLTVQCGLSIYFLTVQCGLSMQLLPMLLTPRQPHASGRLSSP
jgi:hypothetical protein